MTDRPNISQGFAPTRGQNLYNALSYRTPEQARVSQNALVDTYLTSIMDLPMRALEYFAPNTPEGGYVPGELRSSPQDRLRGQRFAWEEHIKNRMRDPDYQRGSMAGNALAQVVDPFFDVPGLAAAKLARPFYKALSGADKLKTAKRLIKSEKGSIGDIGDYGQYQEALAEGIYKKIDDYAKSEKHDTAEDLITKIVENAEKQGLSDFGLRVMTDNPVTGKTYKLKKGDYLEDSFDWGDSFGDETFRLEGTSTIGLNYDGFDVEDLKSNLKEIIAYRPDETQDIVLVGGRSSYEGNDIGEKIIVDGEVLLNISELLDK